MPLHDLDRAVGPAEALLLEVDEGIGHHPLAVAALEVGGRQALLEHPQAQLGVLGDAPFRPSQLVQHAAPDHGHGAVLDDRVAVVAGDHADVEEALVLGVAEPLEGALVLVAVVLRRLHHGDPRVAEVRHHVPEPVGVDAVVGIDHRDHLDVRRHVAQGEVQRAGLEAFQRGDVEEAEALAQARAVRLDRLPDGRVAGVVVDHQDFVVRVVEAGKGVEGLLQQFRRLVVAGHVDRHLGPIGLRGGDRQEWPAPLARPDRLGQLVGLGEQHDDHPQRADAQQRADGQAEPGAVLLAVVVGDPHQHRGAGERDHGEEGPPALAQRGTVDQQQGEGEYREYRRGDGQGAPLGNRHHRPGEVELGLAVGVVDAPVGAHRAFGADLPGLVEGFDDEVAVAFAVERVGQAPQVDGLVRGCRLGAAAHAPVARPADLGEQQRLPREGGLEFARAFEHEVHRVGHRRGLPVGQDVGGDQVDVLRQFRVFAVDVPLFGGGHRNLDRRADPVEVGDQLFRRHLAAEQRLVADYHSHHARRLVGDADGAGDLGLVAGQVRAEPDAQADAQAERLGQRRDVAERALDRIGADAVGVPGDQFQVGAHLFGAGVAAALRVLVEAERREGEAGDAFRPVRYADRTVVQGPDAGEEGGQGDDDHQVEPDLA
ncbi:hypothetical protein PAERUG_E5_London_17_VIM_2_12_12_05150 [Pseudomonas aeruginosa]|nr:hypothetical protein PAERUG_E5_London_17_VIM_2_12_12_05150 [Pseudomonas aeruginosa]